MVKILPSQMLSINKQNHILEFLIFAFKDKEAKNLVQTFITTTELSLISKRLQIAKELQNGRTYEQIQAYLSVTPNTVAKVSLMLKKASNKTKNIIGNFNKIGEHYIGEGKHILKKDKIINAKKPSKSKQHLNQGQLPF